MKAVIYARYSSDAQRDESIDGQIRECTEFARRKNYTIITHYIDRALSARTADRPEFQHMIKDSEKGLFDTVLVWKLDRFSRDRYDSAYYKHVLKKNGVKVVSATESISEGPEGIILEAMLEGMAEYYSAELKEKVARGHKENALKCKHNGGTTPYGYYIDQNDHVLAVHAERAAIVREIFDKYDKGVQIVDIMRDLNDRGIRCGYGHPFTKGRIGAILRNRRYIGEYKYGDVVVPGGMPAIIDQEQFERVNRKLGKNRLAKSSSKATDEYLLTTKLFCGICGRMMIGESGSAHYNGRTYRYYKCGGAKRNLCGRGNGIRKNWIEKLVTIITMDVILNDNTINRVADAILSMQDKEDPALPGMRQQLSNCEKRISNLLNAMENGVVTPSTKERLEGLEKERTTLSSSILKLELDTRTYSKFEIVSWLNRYRSCDINDKEYQRELISSLVNAIFVFEDRCVFIYNFQNDTKTVGFDEMKEAFKLYLDKPAPKQLNAKLVFLKSTFGFVVSKDRMRRLHLAYNHIKQPDKPSDAE